MDQEIQLLALLLFSGFNNLALSVERVSWSLSHTMWVLVIESSLHYPSKRRTCQSLAKILKILPMRPTGFSKDQLYMLEKQMEGILALQEKV